MKKLKLSLVTLRNDLYKNQNNNGCLNFFQLTKLHYSICLEVGIGTFNDDNVSYEKLCDTVPKKFGSRSTIQSILKEAVLLGYFIKDTSKKDKRIKTYTFSNEFTLGVKDWIESLEVEITKGNSDDKAA